MSSSTAGQSTAVQATESRGRSVRSFRVALALIGLAAMAVRVSYVLAAKMRSDTCDVTPGPGSDGPWGWPCGDAVYYAAQALRLAEGDGFVDPLVGGPAADHPPMTALLATPAAVLFDEPLLAQRLTMAVVGTVTVVVIGVVARRLAGDRAGLLAAGLAAVHPGLWVNDGVVMAESPAALATTLLALSALVWWDRPITRHALLVGIAGGVCALARSELLLLAVVVVLPMVVAGGAGRALAPRDRFRTVGVVAVRGTGVLALWVVPNLVRFEEPVVLSTNDGLTIAGAYCHDVFEGPAVGFWDLGCALRTDPDAVDPVFDLSSRSPFPGDQSAVAAAQRDVGLHYAADHVRSIPRVALFRVGRVWGLYAPDQMVWLNQGEGRERALSWWAHWTFFALVGLSAVGTWAHRSQGWRLWPMLAPFLTVTITAAVFYGIFRFRIPAEVSVVVLGGLGADAVIRRLTR